MPRGSGSGSSGGGPLSLRIDDSDLRKVDAAMRKEADGKELRRDLQRNIRAATNPLVSDLKSTISAVGTGAGQPSITRAIAAQIKPVIRTTGASVGVSVKAGDVGVRGFRKAARAFNSPSWRHPVYGGKWVTQRSRAPRWFDKTTLTRKNEMNDAVEKAIGEMVRRIARRAK